MESTVMPAAMAQDFMKDINNFDAMLARFEMDLKRVEVTGYTEDGMPLIKKVGSQRLTDAGIKDIVGSIRTVLNPNTAYSYLTEEQFNLEMRNMAITTDTLLWTKIVEWQIDLADYRPLCTQINTMKALAMRKAIGKNFQEFTSSTKSTVENRIIEEKAGGIFPGINWGPSQKKQY